MRADILTLFPGMIEGIIGSSMVAKAVKLRALNIRLVNIRNFAEGRHRQTDDYAYGGFAGMVMKPEPLYRAINHCLGKSAVPVIYFSPQGRPLNQKIVEHYSAYGHLVMICGHYKEIDQRIRDLCVSDEISLGDYVLSGGEIAAMAMIDGIARLLPGVLNDPCSAESDSFSAGGLGYPCWTRPETFMGQSVPAVLTSGNHKAVDSWIDQRSAVLTRVRRPDLDDPE